MEFGQLMRRLLGRAWWLLCACGTTGWGQTDVVIRWVDEAGEPACQLNGAGHTLHISTWMDGVDQHAVQGADLVVDESGISAWNGADRGVYTLEALPWAWTLVVDDAESRQGDTLTLVWPSRRPLKLRGNPASVCIRKGIPGARLAAFTEELEMAQDSLDLDQLVGLGLVGGGVDRTQSAQSALRRALDSASSWQTGRLESFAPHSLWRDLAHAQILEWRMGLGASASDTAFSARQASLDPRTWGQKLASPGWCSAWELEHETWWKPLEERRAPWRSWAATGQVDSLCQAMSWTRDEVHLAMWLGKSQPWSRWAEGWWDVRWRDQCEVADIRRLSDQTQAHLSSAQSWGDMRWMLPNGDLEPAWAGEGSWNVWLVTRDGSSAGDRELVSSETGWMNEAGPGVAWGVLSVDGDEQGLYATLKKRANVREQVRWVGRDPGWWDRLDILGVPQVVVVRPDGQIQTHQAPLPSEGLFTAMRRWQKLSGSVRR